MKHPSAAVPPTAASRPAPVALQAERLSWSQALACWGDAVPADASGLLGAMVWGLPADPGLPAGWSTLALAPGDAAQPVRVDAWLGAGPVTQGQQGALRWRCDGRHVFAALDLPDHAEADLEAQAYRAYLDLFGLLEATGCPHLLRLWNYLPRINAETDAAVAAPADRGAASAEAAAGHHRQRLERYRQFNSGRQRAFIEAGRAAFEGAPAACALGSAGGGLSVRLLAGQRAPVALENPRQVPAWRYSSRYGPRAPTFSRAALVPLASAGPAGAAEPIEAMQATAALADGQLALFVSGTASIVGEASVHPGDLQGQLAETLRNLQAVIDAARARSSADFQLAGLTCTVYVRHAADVAAVRAGLEAALGAESPAARDAVYLLADVCRADLLLEIEGHAVAAGTLR